MRVNHLITNIRRINALDFLKQGLKPFTGMGPGPGRGRTSCSIKRPAAAMRSMMHRALVAIATAAIVVLLQVTYKGNLANK